jgi:hypothetical protein
MIKDRYVEITTHWDREIEEVWHEYESGAQMYIVRTFYHGSGITTIRAFSPDDLYVRHSFSNVK